MKARHLPYLLIAAGLVLIGLAVRQWYHFYAALAAHMRVGLDGAWPCLYITPSACQFGQGVPHFDGFELYHPWMLWLGTSVVAGALLSLALMIVRRSFISGR